MLSSSDQATAYHTQGGTTPANCFVCTSTANGSCCKDATATAATTCDSTGATWYDQLTLLLSRSPLMSVSSYALYKSSCVSTCPSGTFNDSGICASCADPHASHCNGAGASQSSACSVSSSSNALSDAVFSNADYDLVNSACVPSCLSSEYRNGNGACTACSTLNPNAATCTINGPTTW